MSDLAMKVLKWQTKGHVGISSATMASIALGLEKNFYHGRFDAPSDPADLRRCMMLVDEIPEIKDSFPLIAKKVKRFSPILREWDSLIALLKFEIKRPDKRAPKTYKWIKELLSDQE
ncbi:hypothetical protein VL83_13880 [Salmonella enterica subsp. enterica serovar Montevideo]|uniref:Uncharacterized protein n=1 Tax=Salmonella montevideo TaxID=115981 RepID=A0A725IES6_SALMO|nr:hypothetical protein [Salmonella enterica subsp. enterica serovar Montevideo]EBO9850911.1 hypothetical protein [Salmonella enterica]HCZ3100465.1 hypothetical protein [Salmonella enterica subsp. enterica serovar Anatum str. CFSAN004012]EBL5254509.1 hypothetical protein [Salmonella enterica subsp. enterica serovar Montevideo]EBL5763364.1 hypothetical protein [Salmonella enterica subsp. enterica serovar Montevideo]